MIILLLIVFSIAEEEIAGLLYFHVFVLSYGLCTVSLSHGAAGCL